MTIYTKRLARSPKMGSRAELAPSHGGKNLTIYQSVPSRRCTGGEVLGYGQSRSSSKRCKLLRRSIKLACEDAFLSTGQASRRLPMIFSST